MSAKEIQKKLKNEASEKDAKILQRFFKTEKGEYGEGDVFIGVRVPEIRKIVSKYTELGFKEIQKLLDSPIHEERFSSLIILNNKFKQIEKDREKIIKFYLKNAKKINNWDLVDVSCPNILGAWILEKPEENKILFKLAKSKNLWEKRISIVSTLKLVRAGELKDALKLCEIHLFDEHDLMNKAVGWVLREIGKKDEKKLKQFLEKYATTMPRVSLRYSLERMNKKDKEYFMKK